MEGKAYIVFILAIAAASEVISENRGCERVKTLCPKTNGVNATLLPNPADCGSYCVCESGRPIYMPCPEGLHFNLAMNVCVSPSSANCGSTTATPEEGSSENDNCYKVKDSCPIPNEVNATLLPNPGDCESYCVCETGTPIYMPCPEGLHFNAKLKVCDWPSSAKCDPNGSSTGDSGEPTPDESVTDSPAHTTTVKENATPNQNDNCYKVKDSCPIPNGVNATLLPNPGDCESYCVCETGTPIYMPCPEGLHFNAKLKVCDWPSSAKCDPNASSTGDSGEPTPDESVTDSPANTTTVKGNVTPNQNDNCYKVKDSCPIPNGVNGTLLPNPGDCESYCVCETGTPIYMPCPEGLHFNAKLKVCDWPSSAKCDPNGSSTGDSGEPTPEESVTDSPANTTTVKENATPNQNDNCYKVKDSCPIPNEVNATLLPNPGDCESYCVCETGTPIYMPCPEGLHFNAKLKVCDWPSSANCDPNGSSTGDSGEPTPDESVTDSPANTTTVKENATPNQNDNCYKVKDSCPIPNGVNATLLPNPGDCESYCVCETETPIYMPCPEGLHFNAKLKVCDWPSSANCDPNGSSTGDSGEPTPDESVTDSPANTTTVKGNVTPNQNDNCYKVKDSCPIPNGVNATLLPNPGDCESYCVCETGTPIYMPCPEGLHFNAKLKVCDWPSSAKCDPNGSSTENSGEHTPEESVTDSPANTTTVKENVTPNQNDNCYKVKDSCPIPNGVNATLLPNPGDCESYCVCETGTPIYMPCPEGLHFNAKLKVCDWPSSENCGQRQRLPSFAKPLPLIHTRQRLNSRQQ